MKIRVRPQTLDALTAAASEYGRPVNREIAARLEASVVADQTGDGSRGTREFIRLWSATVGAIELQRDKKWLEDKATWNAVMSVTMDMMKSVKPPLPDELESAVEGPRTEVSTALAVAEDAQGEFDAKHPAHPILAGLRLPVGSVLASEDDLQEFESDLARLARLKYALSEAQFALETAEAPMKKEIRQAIKDGKAVAAEIQKKFSAVGAK